MAHFTPTPYCLMALAASMASGGGTAKKKDTGEWLEDVLKEVTALKNNQKSIREVLDDWGTVFSELLAKAIVEAIRQTGRATQVLATGTANTVASTMEKLLEEAQKKLKLRGLDIEDG